MKALTFSQQHKRFEYKTLEVPTPGYDDLLLRVEACGLNPVDAKISQWSGMISDQTIDFVPGLDISGEIVEMGEDVEGFYIGQKVLCHGNMLRPHGGFAEYSVQSAATVIPHPDLLPVQAAAIPCAGWTAWRALVDKLQLNNHDSILIAGGAGGVGSYAIQIANYLGAKRIIATGSAKNEDYISRLGATNFINYQQDAIHEKVMQITSGVGVSKGLDAVGGDNDILVANSLSYEGQMVDIVRTLRPDAYDGSFLKGLGFHQLSLGSGHRNGNKAQKEMIDAGKQLTGLVENGDIRLPEINTIGFAEVADALSGMLAQRTVGKIVMAFNKTSLGIKQQNDKKHA